jgi:hypothetical protein
MNNWRGLFHKALKSGCKAEEVEQRTEDRRVNLLAFLYPELANLLDDARTYGAY